MNLSASLGPITLLLCSAPALAAELSDRSRPIAVSPGEERGAGAIESRCPTFSWGSQTGAAGYELVVYEVAADTESDTAAPALRHVVAGSASTWTPPLDRCLERGGVYAWSVRAVTGRSRSEWSAPRFFEVAAGPSRDDFEAALEVVRQYLADSSEPREQRLATTSADSLHREGSSPTSELGSARVGPRREAAAIAVGPNAFSTSGTVNLGGRVTFGGGVQFANRVTMTAPTPGVTFATSAIEGTNVCNAGYHPCTGWEAMMLDTLSADELFPQQCWVVGSFPNADGHLRSLADGNITTVCPATFYLSKFPSVFSHGGIASTGGLHCHDGFFQLPVCCCSNKDAPPSD